MEAPKLMLFDLGGVLVENAAFGRLGRLLPGSPGAEDLRGRWMRSSAVRRFELGQAGPGEFADEFIAEWGLGLSAGAFLAEFGSWVGGLAPGGPAERAGVQAGDLVLGRAHWAVDRAWWKLANACPHSSSERNTITRSSSGRWAAIDAR